MAIKKISNKEIEWLHVADFEKDDVKELGEKFKLHPLTLKDIASPIENPKVDIFPEYIFGVFHFPEIRKQEKRIVTHELNVIIMNGHFITLCDSSFRIMRNIFYTVARTPSLKKEYFGENPAKLFYNILLRSLQLTLNPTLQYIRTAINEIESKVYEEESNREALIKIATIRRNILNLKRILEPQLPIIHSLGLMDNKFIGKKYAEYFDDIDDYAERISGMIKNQLEILEGLHATNESLIQYRTNKVIKALTILSVVFMPLTLISGIYGMNVHLPLANNPSAILTIFLAVSVATLGLIYWITKKVG